MAIVKQSEPPLALRSFERRTRAHAAALPTALSPDLLRHIPQKQVRYAAAKRAVDVVLAAFGLVALSWLYLLVAIVVKLTSRGPVIFTQARVGAGGQLFTCYKFRSMCADAELRRHELRARNEATGPVFKMRNDPRLTPVGGLLRKLSLDELPQLLNVLKGDMSIVGPRPPIPHEVEEYDERALGRLAVRPGLTCLWQVNGRSDIPFEHWVELDLLYIRTMSFWADLGIILRTVPAVLSGRGAH